LDIIVISISRENQRDTRYSVRAKGLTKYVSATPTKV
jgi:hypothetical protein